VSRRIDNPVILINHWRWLQVNGTKQQAASPKPQAPSCKLDSWPETCYRIIKEKEL